MVELTQETKTELEQSYVLTLLPKQTNKKAERSILNNMHEWLVDLESNCLRVQLSCELSQLPVSCQFNNSLSNNFNRTL